MNKNLKGSFILLITAIIWGSSFVSQKIGVETVNPMTFIGLRTLLGALVLFPVILIKDKFKLDFNKELLTGGLLCGIILCIATVLQTYGMVYIDAGKSGFLTSLYMIFVPVIGIFLGKKLTFKNFYWQKGKVYI